MLVPVGFCFLQKISGIFVGGLPKIGLLKKLFSRLLLAANPSVAWRILCFTKCYCFVPASLLVEGLFKCSSDFSSSSSYGFGGLLWWSFVCCFCGAPQGWSQFKEAISHFNIL